MSELPCFLPEREHLKSTETYKVQSQTGIILLCYPLHANIHMSSFVFPFYCGVILHCLDTPYFVYSFTYQWIFGCFQFGAIKNKIFLNASVQVFCAPVFMNLSKYIGNEWLDSHSFSDLIQRDYHWSVPQPFRGRSWEKMELIIHF